MKHKSERILETAIECVEFVSKLLRKGATVVQLTQQASISEPNLYPGQDTSMQGRFSDLNARRRADADRRWLKR